MNDLKPSKGANVKRKRLGRGIGSGLGKTSGRGGKGQTARNGGGIPARFEGGQTPLYRRIPKRGFNNYNFRQEWDVVNIGNLAHAIANGVLKDKEIGEKELRSAGLLPKGKNPVKLLAGSGKSDGNSNSHLKGFTLKVDAVSESAKAAMEAAGATIVLNVAPEANG